VLVGIGLDFRFGNGLLFDITWIVSTIAFAAPSVICVIFGIVVSRRWRPNWAVMITYCACIPLVLGISQIFRPILIEYAIDHSFVSFFRGFDYPLGLAVAIASTIASILYIRFFHQAIQARKAGYQQPRRIHGRTCFPALIDQVNPSYPFGTRMYDGCTSCQLGLRLNIAIAFTIVISILGLGSTIAVICLIWPTSGPDFNLVMLDMSLGTIVPSVTLLCVGVLSLAGKVARPNRSATYLTLAMYAAVSHIASTGCITAEYGFSLLRSGNLYGLISLGFIILSTIVTVGVSLCIFQLLERALEAVEEYPSAVDGGSNLPLLIGS